MGKMRLDRSAVQLAIRTSLVVYPLSFLRPNDLRVPEDRLRYFLCMAPFGDFSLLAICQGGKYVHRLD